MRSSSFGPALAARRMSWFLLFVIGVALTVTLYFVKTQSQSARAEVRAVTKAIAAEDAAIRVLRAERAYLQSPARLAELNATHLKLSPTMPEQEMTVSDIIKRFPLPEADVEAGEGGTP